MRDYYNPDEFLGRLLGNSLKLDTMRKECPDDLWQSIRREQRLIQARIKESQKPTEGLVRLNPVTERAK